MQLIVKGKTNWKILLIIIIIVTVVGGVLFWFLNKQENRLIQSLETDEEVVQENKNDSESLSSSELANWETYTNKEYSYSFESPENRPIFGHNVYDEEESIAPIIAVSTNGIEGPFEQGFVVEAQNDDQLYINLGSTEENILDWAERIRQINLRDNNPNTPMKTVGDLQETTVSGQKGYKFTLTDAFAYPGGGGQVLPTDQVYIYHFVADNNGLKFMIWYPEGDLNSIKIFNSFKFLD